MPVTPDVVPVYLHPHAAANEPVTLLEGPIAIQGGATGTGTLKLRWLPSTGLRLEADLSTMDAPQPGARVNADLAGSTAEVLFNSMSIGNGDSGPFARVGGSISAFERGTGAGLKEIGFQIVNFQDFLTPGPRQASIFGFPPHVAELRYGGWRIRLTAVEQSREIFKSLGETGGYAFTHLGRLERDDSSLFAAPDAEAILRALARFLSFARGAACSLPIRWGAGRDGNIVWEQWRSQPIDPWKGRDNWFDEHHGNLLSELFGAFAQADADAELGPPFWLALHWYQKSNTRAGGMEGAIILGLTALDLLGAMVVVDRAAAMSASKYDNLPAKQKLAQLLDVMKVPTAIPAKLSQLAAFAATNGWQTACEALAEIRHGYVHSNRKRRQVVLSAPNLATFEAWQLSLWYQELALLYLLDHPGEYRNRLTAGWLGEVERVPWV
jgi:hypothetical protein